MPENATEEDATRRTSNRISTAPPKRESRTPPRRTPRHRVKTKRPTRRPKALRQPRQQTLRTTFRRLGKHFTAIRVPAE